MTTLSPAERRVPRVPVPGKARSKARDKALAAPEDRVAPGRPRRSRHRSFEMIRTCHRRHGVGPALKDSGCHGGKELNQV